MTAQVESSDYEDLNAFSTDPIELDSEYHRIFGRFFQTSFALGSSILTADLSEAYDAGLMARLMFVFYFDQVWAAEIGIGFSRHTGRYEDDADNFDFDVTMQLIPIYIGFRYGFNKRDVSRGLGVMNPYLSGQFELIFRREEIDGGIPAVGFNENFDEAGESNSDTAFGFNFGGGVEFDVYKQELFLGIDLRYHVIIWPDESDTIGDFGREGHYVSILLTGTYNY